MATKLLAAVTATGVSSSLNFRAGVRDHAIQATTTGAPTAVTVVLEGSLDGETYFTLDSHAFSAGEITAQAAYWNVSSQLTHFVRLNLSTLTGGTSPTVTGLYLHDEVNTRD